MRELFLNYLSYVADDYNSKLCLKRVIERAICVAEFCRPGNAENVEISVNVLVNTQMDHT
jgi:hypothetical protein